MIEDLQEPLWLGAPAPAPARSAPSSCFEGSRHVADPAPDAESRTPLAVLFAGEHTHRMHYSTMHGAWLSGVREARRLRAAYGKPA